MTQLQQSKEQKKFLYVPEVAERLGYSPKTIAKWCREGGVFPHAEVVGSGRRAVWRIPPHDVEAVEAGRVKLPTTGPSARDPQTLVRKNRPRVSDCPYRNRPGWITGYFNRLTEDWVTVYEAAKRGIDVEGRYVVVCEKHGAVTSANSRRDARALAREPGVAWALAREPINFCGACAALAEEQAKKGQAKA